MRRATAAIACAVLLTVLSAPAHARAAGNGMLAAVADGKLVTVNPDGSGLRTLWAPTADITSLAWSPDGNKLALISGGKLVVWDVVAGTGKTLPTDAVRDADPTWSADGNEIGFRRIGPLTQSRVRVKADFSDLRTELPAP